MNNRQETIEKIGDILTQLTGRNVIGGAMQSGGLFRVDFDGSVAHMDILEMEDATGCNVEIRGQSMFFRKK